jgi:uncharacterized protein
MSEIINNPANRKELLKHMILQLHQGEAPDLVRRRLIDLLQNIPYDEVVEVEQELISEGLPAEEVLKFCDIHTMVLDGHIDQSGAKPVPPGHPADTFSRENREIEKVILATEDLLKQIRSVKEEELGDLFLKLHSRFNELSDIDKHYKRKEYLLFPFLEKYEITGPPKVMWGKHDEVRDKLKASLEIVSTSEEISRNEAVSVAELVLYPTLQSIADMIMKEEEILLPMSMDKLTDSEWYAIYRQTLEFGYCLYDPQDEWTPENVATDSVSEGSEGTFHLSTGQFNPDELDALFKTLPVDITFVDKDDKVKFFSLGTDRIFTRNRAILGRDVRMCHPPASVNVVEQILYDFKNGIQNSADFWINMKGRFIYIQYLALRGKDGEYLGTVEITQDATGVRKLEGEQRLLSYSKKVKP